MPLALIPLWKVRMFNTDIFPDICWHLIALYFPPPFFFFFDSVPYVSHLLRCFRNASSTPVLFVNIQGDSFVSNTEIRILL